MKDPLFNGKEAILLSLLSIICVYNITRDNEISDVMDKIIIAEVLG